MNIYILPSFKKNSNLEIQLILLMIPNGEGWHHFVVKKLSVLLSGIMSKEVGDCYCLNCFHSLRGKNKLACF